MKDTIGLLFVFGILGLYIYGWVMNIVALATSNESTGMMILRGVGILAGPLGSILGFI